MTKNNIRGIFFVCLVKAIEKKAAKEEKAKGTSALNIKITESANCVKFMKIPSPVCG